MRGIRDGKRIGLRIEKDGIRMMVRMGGGGWGMDRKQVVA